MVQSTPWSFLMQASQAKVLPRWCRRQNGSLLRPGGSTVGDGFVVVEVAAVGGDGAGREAAGSGADGDGFG